MKLYYRKFCRFLADLMTPIEVSTNMKAWEFKNKFLRIAKIKIGKQVAIGPKFQSITGCEHLLAIGDYVTIGNNVKIYNFDKVLIDDFCMIAADVCITNGGHDLQTLEPFSGEIVIGKGCWIGNGARIIGPVKIGNNAIIGAGSLVLKDVPESVVVVGVPARIIKERELPGKVWHLGDVYFNPHTFQISK